MEVHDTLIQSLHLPKCSSDLWLVDKKV